MLLELLKVAILDLLHQLAPAEKVDLQLGVELLRSGYTDIRPDESAPSDPRVRSTVGSRRCGIVSHLPICAS